MAVGIVAGDPVAQPDDVGRAQGIAKDAVVFFAAHARVAALGLLVEQAFLGSQQGATTVHVDTAAFQHNRLARARDREEPHPAPLGDSLRDAVVLLPVRVFGPGGELELDDGNLGVRSRLAHADGPKIAGPAAIRSRAKKLHVVEVGVGAAQNTPRPRFLGWPIDDDAHLLARCDLADDFAIGPFDGVKLARPVGATVGPTEPGGLMRLPFGGHGEAKLGWCLGAGDLHRL